MTTTIQRKITFEYIGDEFVLRSFRLKLFSYVPSPKLFRSSPIKNCGTFTASVQISHLLVHPVRDTLRLILEAKNVVISKS
jgi:hypothetical protein